MSRSPGSQTDLQQHPRVAVRLRVRLSSIDPETDPVTGSPYFRFFDETCLNLSKGGAMVVTPDPLEAGQRVLVELDLPGDTLFQAVGRVAWSKVMSVESQESASGAGIEFTAATREQFSQLERVIARGDRGARPSVPTSLAPSPGT